MQPIGVKQPILISSQTQNINIYHENIDNQIESSLVLEDIIDDKKDYIVKLVPLNKIRVDKDGADTY